LSGALPWIPKVNFLTSLVEIENGDELTKRFHLAAEEGQGILTITDNDSRISDLPANNGAWAAI
jgi:hypothetical protein